MCLFESAAQSIPRGMTPDPLHWKVWGFVSATPFGYSRSRLVSWTWQVINCIRGSFIANVSMAFWGCGRTSVAAMFEPRERLGTVLWGWLSLGGSDRRRRLLRLQFRGKSVSNFWFLVDHLVLLVVSGVEWGSVELCSVAAFLSEEMDYDER